MNVRSLPVRIVAIALFGALHGGGMPSSKASTRIPALDKPALSKAMVQDASVDRDLAASVPIEQNIGQSPPVALFLARSSGMVAKFTTSGLELLLAGTSDGVTEGRVAGPRRSGRAQNPRLGSPGSVERAHRLRVSVSDEYGPYVLHPEGELSLKSHFLKGSDPSRWATNVPNFSSIRYDRQPGGAEHARVSVKRTSVSLEIVVPAGSVGRPFLFRIDGESSGRTVAVSTSTVAVDRGCNASARVAATHEPGRGSQYRIVNEEAGTFNLDLGGREVSETLRVQLVLDLSAFDDGTSNEASKAVAVDSSGSAYTTGWTQSADFPVTPGTADPTLGGMDAFVTKLSPDGLTPLYSTYLGGNAIDDGFGVAVDGYGSAYVTGWTNSPDFPVTASSFDPAFSGGYSAFVTKLSPDGSSLVYSTYLGGGIETRSDRANAITVNSAGEAFVCGMTSRSTFPTTAGTYSTALSGFGDAFITKLSADGGSLVFSTFLGGVGEGGAFEEAHAIRVGVDGSVFVAGVTTSADFPTTPGAFDLSYGTSADAFVTKLSFDGVSLLYSTFLGGGMADYAYGLTVEASGTVFVCGLTVSSDFPTTPGVVDASLGGNGDGFVTALASDGSSLVFSTYLGGSSIDAALGISLDIEGQPFVTGRTSSADYPLTSGAFDAVYGGTYEGFVTQLSPGGTLLAHSTFLGGSDVDEGIGIVADRDGFVWVAGTTISPDFPGAVMISPETGFIVRFRTSIGGKGSDTIGVHVGSTSGWFLRDSNTPGAATHVFGYGPPNSGWTPLSGDWNGDSVDTPGLYDPTTSCFFLRNASNPGPAETVVCFGAAGAGYVPVSGDWDGDGLDTVGLYSPTTGFYFLRNSNGPGPADLVFSFGAGGAGHIPVVGDWNNDGVDTVGLYARTAGVFFLRNSNSQGSADLTFGYGSSNSTWQPLSGNWDGWGGDSVGLYDPTTGAFFLRNSTSSGPANSIAAYGPLGITPLAGDWDGQ